jgi:transposase
MEELIASGKIEKRVEDHREEKEGEYISRYTIDVEVRTIVTEHRYANTDEMPEEMLRNEVTYGENIKILTAVLSAEEMVAEKRMGEFYESITEGAVRPSTGTLNEFLRETAEKIDVKPLEESLLNGKNMNVDETPLRSTEREIVAEDDSITTETAEHTTYQVCVRSHSNEDTTLYTVNGKKDKKGVERDGILPNYKGNLVHDFEKKYLNYGKTHALCGAHVLRELKGLEKDNAPEVCRVWAGEMTDVLNGMNGYKKSDLLSGSERCSLAQLETFKKEFTDTINSGRQYLDTLTEKSIYRGKMANIVKRMTKYQPEYQRFMEDYSVPFTNNLAERDLRLCKTKQKVSGCFRSSNGVKTYCKIRSVISTAKKRGMDLFGTFKKVLRGEPVFS